MPMTGNPLLFPTRSEQPDPHCPRRKVQVIQCSHCPTEATAPVASGSNSLGDEMLVRKFSRLGWYVGRVIGSHLCPGCNPTKQRSVVTIVTPPKEEAPQTMSKITISPVEMSFSDRRIIIAKIDEVYGTELTGYKDAWNDARIAADLGVPVTWVSKLRSENFGPAEGNTLMRDLRAEAAAISKELGLLGEQVLKANERLEAVEKKLAA